MSPARQAVPGPAAPDPPSGIPRSECWRVRHCPAKTCAVITLPPSLLAQAFALLCHMAAGRVSLAAVVLTERARTCRQRTVPSPNPNPVMAAPFPAMSLPSHSASRAPDRKRDRLPSLYISACRTNGAPPWVQVKCLRSWFMPQNFLGPQRDQPMLVPVDMREWLPEDDLVFVVLDAVATLDLDGFRRRYRADGHGRAAFDPEMMVALLLYGYCQGERSSRVIEKRCVRDVAYRVITGGLCPDHATIARFRACHQEALGGLFSQVLRLLAAEGMVSLGTLSLDGTKLAGNASQKANKTLPQIEKLLAEAAAADAAEDARLGDALDEPAPRALARRAERRERLAAARDRLAAEDQARRDAQRAKQQAWDAAAAAGNRRGHRSADEPPRTNHNNTEPRANITDPDVRIMRNQKGYVAGYNGQLVVTAQQVIVGAMLSQHPVDRTLLGKRVLVTGA